MKYGIQVAENFFKGVMAISQLDLTEHGRSEEQDMPTIVLQVNASLNPNLYFVLQCIRRHHTKEFILGMNDVFQ